MLAGACGDDGDGDAGTAADETTTTSSSVAEETATSAPEAPADPQLDALVLRLSDFPAGWTSEPADEDEEAEQTGEEVEDCLGIEVDDDERPEADSPEFSQGQLTQVSSSVSLAPDAASVDAEFAVLQGPRLLDCMRQEFDAAAGGDAELAFAPSTAERLDFPDVGDGTVASRLTTAVTVGGQQIPIYADLVFVRKGLAELSFSFVNAGEPFPAALAADLVAKVLARA